MFSFLTRKKRKGGLSIIFGETVIYKQNYITIVPESRPISRNKPHTFFGRFVPNSRNSPELEGVSSKCNSSDKKIEHSEVPYEFLDTLAPSPDLSQVTYSVNKIPQTKHLSVPSKLLNTLSSASVSTTNSNKVPRKPSPQRSRIDFSETILKPKPIKKVRFADEVTIHRVSIHKHSPVPYPETFKLIITLQCIWGILDEDKDGFLNLKELSYFVDAVWEDEDSEKILKSYAKEPKKGINFDEWCNLVKDEDPHLSELVNDLYVLFVEGSKDSKEVEDENSIADDNAQVKLEL